LLPGVNKPPRSSLTQKAARIVLPVLQAKRVNPRQIRKMLEEITAYGRKYMESVNQKLKKARVIRLRAAAAVMPVLRSPHPPTSREIAELLMRVEKLWRSLHGLP